MLEPKQGMGYIPARYQHVVFGLLMSFMMSGFMSAIITFINLGWVTGFLLIWLKAWVLAFIVAFPAIVMLGPLVRKIVSRVVITG
jgi:hypothetical protein